VAQKLEEITMPCSQSSKVYVVEFSGVDQHVHMVVIEQTIFRMVLLVFLASIALKLLMKDQ
jgi:REP element-mobilizing transposase RayT